MHVQDGPAVVEQVDSEVQGARIRQLVPQLRRGLRIQITLREESRFPNPLIVPRLLNMLRLPFRMSRLMGTHYALSRWDKNIETQFEAALPGGKYIEAEFYGAYNSLVCHLFPFMEQFQVVPQYRCLQKAKSVDYTTMFLVRTRKQPAFFLEVKPSISIKRPSLRRATDHQIRDRYLDTLVISRYLSCMG